MQQLAVDPPRLRAHPVWARHSSLPPTPFLLCVGDDRSDEDMFVAVNTKEWLRSAGGEPTLDRTRSWPRRQGADGVSGDGAAGGTTAVNAPDEGKWSDAELIRSRNPPSPFTFTVCVGMKPSNAHYYLHDDEEVLKTLHSLATCSERMQQSRLLRNNSLNALMQLQRTQTLPTTTLTGSQANLVALANVNSLSLASGQRELMAAMARGIAMTPMSTSALRAGGSRTGSQMGLNGTKGLNERKALSEEDEDEVDMDDSGEEYEYGSGDEDGETIGM